MTKGKVRMAKVRKKVIRARDMECPVCGKVLNSTRSLMVDIADKKIDRWNEEWIFVDMFKCNNGHLIIIEEENEDES